MLQWSYQLLPACHSGSLRAENLYASLCLKPPYSNDETIKTRNNTRSFIESLILPNLLERNLHQGFGCCCEVVLNICV